MSTYPLITVVIARHHRYLHRVLPLVQELSEDVARLHGGRTPALVALAELVDDLARTVLFHLEREERVVFPGLLAGAEVTDALRVTREEHDVIAAMLRRVRALAGGFAPPPGAGASHRTLLRALEELEARTTHAIDLENELLEPRFVVSSAG